MKRAGEFNQVISDSSSDSDSGSDSKGKEGDGSAKKSVKKPPKNLAVKYSLPEVNPAKKRAAAFDFAALSRHGYSSGPSVLKVPPPRESDKDQDWSWSIGTNRPSGKEVEESYEDREKTRAALTKGEMLSTALTREERKKDISFSQKEKRKRNLGQSSRGKNYVEEEKRLLRDSGVYSGFD